MRKPSRRLLIPLITVLAGLPGHRVVAADNAVGTLPARATSSTARRVYHATRLAGDRPRIDGKLDDTSWNQGQWDTDFIQREPNEGNPASLPTALKILYDDRNLYVAIRASDPAIGSLPRLRGKRDESIGDMVGLAVDTYLDHRTAVEFDVTSGGSKVDLARTDDATDTSWNAVWDVKVGTEAGAWTAEYRIPLSQLRYSKNAEQVWGLHSWRRIDRLQEESDWHLIPVDNPGFVYSFGELRGIDNLPRSRRIELLPYVSGKYATTKAEPGNPYRKGSESVFESGLDAKIGLASNFTLDLCLNPDFGQVEADPSEINLNTFETKLEERRPFFIEGKSILEFNFGDVTQVFYSRRIGRTPSLQPSTTGFVEMPKVTRILGSAKVTGKTPGGLSVGVLLAQTDKELARISEKGIERREVVEPATSYSLVRFEQTINHGNTRFGGILTSTMRQLKSDTPGSLTKTAYAVAVDGEHYWGNRTYFMDFTLIGTRIKGSRAAITNLQSQLVHNYARPDATHLGVDYDATSLQGTGGDLNIGKGNNGNWRYQTSVDWRSPGFELNDLGYLKASDQFKQEALISYVQTRPGKTWRRYNLQLSYAGRYDISLNALQKDFTLSSSFTSKKNWVYTGRTAYRTEILDHRLLRGGPAILTPNNIAVSGSVRTDTSRKQDYRLSFTRNSSTDGLTYSTNVATTFTARPRNTINLQADLSYTDAVTDLQYMRTVKTGGISRYLMGNLEQKTLSASLRVDVNLTPQLSLSFYGSPFLSSGRYTNLKRVTSSRAPGYNDRFIRLDKYLTYNNATATYAVTGDGSPYSFANSNFNAREFKSNLVLRWEYQAGSTAYLVWSQYRTAPTVTGDFSFGPEYQRLFGTRPDNTLMLKISYWFSI